MDLFGLGGRIFRARLKRELPRWRAEAIISPAAEETLASRYQLDEEGVSVATAAIYLLGVLLIGGGVISLVAWNWDALGRFSKLALIGTAMVAAHVSGYWLWKGSGRMPKLGHALMLLGTLIFGANIGLVAQIFHIHTDPSAGLAAWALGAAVAAWVLPSVPHGVLAAGITTIWAPVFFEEHHALYLLTPWMVAVPSFLLAWRMRSRVMFLASVGATAWCLALAAGFETGEPSAVALAILACAAPLLALSLDPRGCVEFRTPARVVGTLGAVTVFYLVSFHEMAEELSFTEMQGEPVSWLGFALPAVLLAVALFVWPVFRDREARRSDWFTLLSFWGCFFVPLALVPADTELWGALAANLILAVLVILAITSSVRTLERGLFWLGALLGGVVILSRFLEFETELWLKAIVFLACGVAVIVVGRLFERHRLRAGEAGR